MSSNLDNRRNILFSAIFVLMTVVLIIASGGNIGAAIAPPIVIALFLAIISLPLRYTATFIFTVVLLFHDPSGNPMGNRWKGPLTLLGPLLHENLHKFTGIAALRFNAIDLGLFLMVTVIAVRTFLGNNIDRHHTMPAASPLKISAFVSLAAILLALIWGMLCGGNFNEALWQFKVLLCIPLLLIICMRAFKTDQDFRRLGVILAVVSVIRIIEGTYFLFAIARPQGLELAYIMTHDDTVPFMTVMIMLISSFFETLSLRALTHLLVIGGFVMFGTVINDRRIAYVSLAMSLATIIIYIRPEIRRWLIRGMLITLPISVLYVVIGMHSQAAIFAPVYNLTSVSNENDPSNYMRDVENFDLIETLRANPVLGTGYGHEYREVLASFDISKFMPNYRYHPHNSILGLAAFTGVVGLYLIWIYLPVGAFLAFRAYHSASTPIQRTTSTTAVCIIIIHMVQSYGDMGIESINEAIILCGGLGCIANLVMRTGGLEDRGKKVSDSPSESA